MTTPRPKPGKTGKVALVGVAVVVLAAVVAMLVAVRSGSDRPASARTGKTSARKAPPPGPGLLPGPGHRTRPTVADSARRRPPEGGTRTSINQDGVVVRDHRSKGAPDVTTPIRVPVTAGKMKPRTIAAVRDVLRPMVRKCETEHAPEIDGDRPQLQAVVRVSVDGDRVIAGDVQVSVRDAQADALMDCVKRAAGDINIAANGHAEIVNYALTFPFRLGR